jgi:PAS domain S-box-containing protein
MARDDRRSPVRGAPAAPAAPGEHRDLDAEKYRFLVEATHTGFVILDGAGRVLDASAEYVRMSGHQALEEILGRSVVEWTAPHDLERNAAEVAKCLATGSVRDFRVDYLGPSGTLVNVELHATVLDGAPAPRIMTVCREVTERRRTEARLQEEEARTRRIIEAMPIGMHLYRLEPGGRLVFVGANPAADRILGVENAQFVGQTIEEAFPPLASTEIPRRYREVVTTGITWETESVEYEHGAIRGAFGVHAFRAGPGSLVVAFQEITERKRAEEALRQSEERFRTLAEALPLSVFEMDLEGRFTYVNHAGLRTFGHTAEEVDAGLGMDQVIVPAQQAQARAMLAERAVGKIGGYVEYEARRKDGTTLPILVATSPILREGSPVGFRGIATDLTERKRLEEEMLKGQKLESIGTLAGGIAHDFNNLLQAVAGLLGMAREAIGDREAVLQLLGQADAALHRSVGLTTQLLTFAKGGRPVKRVIRLGPVIEGAVTLALSGSRVQSAVRLAPDLRPVEADAGQIAQVIQNIVLNADQAMPNGGQVTVEARNVDAPTGDGQVELTIRDTGPGISPEHLSRVFDPYFTTKVKGSGLGLATCYSIVRNHGGVITVGSEPGRGSTFTIRLPATDLPLEEARAEVARPLPPGRRILVMDDEPLVRQVAGALARSLGHHVELAEDGEQAVRIYGEAIASGHPFDAVILDLTVRGGMGGKEALARLRALDPGVKAIVSSGYSAEAPLASFEQLGFRAVLGKPYTRDALDAVLRSLLG